MNDSQNGYCSVAVVHCLLLIVLVTVATAECSSRELKMTKTDNRSSVKDNKLTESIITTKSNTVICVTRYGQWPVWFLYFRCQIVHCLEWSIGHRLLDSIQLRLVEALLPFASIFLRCPHFLLKMPCLGVPGSPSRPAACGVHFGNAVITSQCVTSQFHFLILAAAALILRQLSSTVLSCIFCLVRV